MLEINVKDCKECGIQDVLTDIDNYLYAVGKNEYHHVAYLANKTYKASHIKRIIRYKNILNNILWNSSYYNMDYKTIISKIKTLI